MTDDAHAQREPIFHMPGVVVWLIGILVAVHLGRTFLLSTDADFEFLLTFAFLPLRYASEAGVQGMLPGGAGADLWTFVSYAFLHGGTMHLVVNSLWLAVFGSAVARRFGTMRFLVFSAVAAAAGAGLHLAAHFGEPIPMVGASAAISAHMAAAARFVFEPGGPLGTYRFREDIAYRLPAVSLLQALSNPRVLTFLGVWFGVNLLFGLGSVQLAGQSGSIAWEAHIGGFLAGLALFSLFDPVPRAGRAQ
ncbi:rhomboid family intramembrane serine protease [Breoghania sp. L-A4]|uniref:rhomboid family intramembrane serine protease n=1 Tax=Breoghania sp. L-A4 TaxID=2304600 RepID=UPI000E359B98|nr:rhomboid family intramembrane serine protease [Breoghania sp. L-A4]AXS41100.1 rhomboid family intramembrane serine protease [Breoghania sp. L-A4]